MSKYLVKAALVNALRDTGNGHLAHEYDDVVDTVAEHVAFELANSRQRIYYVAAEQGIDPRLAHTALVHAGLAEASDRTAEVIAEQAGFGAEIIPVPEPEPNVVPQEDQVEEAQAKQRGLFSRVFGVR
jgi:hypothetical protein